MEVCRNFRKGRCEHGEHCRYLHTTSNHQQQQEKSFEARKQPLLEVCRKFQLGRCKHGAQCRYLHEEANTSGNGASRGNEQPSQHNMPKSKPSSEAASDGHQKSEGKVEPVAEAPPEAASDGDQKSEGKVESVAEAPPEAASDGDQKSEGKVEPVAEALPEDYPKPGDGTDYVPPRPDHPQSSGFRGGHGNDGLSGHSRDNSSESGFCNSVFCTVSTSNLHGATKTDGGHPARQAVPESCKDLKTCRQKIVYDFENENPLWELSCYSHIRCGPCEITGDISYEELRAKAYKQSKQGHPQELIAETERNLQNEKMTEFKNFVNNICLSKTQCFPSGGSFCDASFGGSQTNGLPVSTTSKQIGVASCFGSTARITAPGVSTNFPQLGTLTVQGGGPSSKGMEVSINGGDEPLVVKLILRDLDGNEIVLGNLKASTPHLRLGSSPPKRKSGNRGLSQQPGLHIVVVDSGQIKDEACLVFHEGMSPRPNQEIPENLLFGMLDNMAEDGASAPKRKQYSVVLRMWPNCDHAVISLRESGIWKLTRKYSTEWTGPPNKDVAAFWSRESPYVEFIGELVESKILDMYVKFTLNPDISDFGDFTYLGKGSGGAVFHGRCLSSSSGLMPCAVKVKIARHLRNEDVEANIMSRFNENNITGFYQAWRSTGKYDKYINANNADRDEKFSDGYNDADAFFHCVFILMEYCPGNLQTYIQSTLGDINTSISWDMFEQIVKAVWAIHSKGIIHCDLKPNNIFLGSSLNIKVGDFDHASLNGERACRTLGTMGYQAPELNHKETVDSEVDIFSLGVILYLLFENREYDYRVLQSFLDLTIGEVREGWPGDRELLMSLTGPPHHRPSAQEIMIYLEGKRQGFADANAEDLN